MSKIFTTTILIHLCLAAFVADAEEVRVVLDNGDILTGELLNEDAGELTLRIEYLGEVNLPIARVHEVVRPDPEVAEQVIETVQAESEEVVVAGQPVPAGPPAPKPDKGETGPLPEEEVIDEEPEQGLFSGILSSLSDVSESLIPLPEWEKRLQFGMNSSSGRKDQANMNYRFEMQRKYGESQMNFDAEYAYGEANDSPTLDKMATNFRWRKDISPGVFYEAKTIYSWDEIKLIESNVEQKLGLGTRFIDKKTSTLSAGVGASGRWREFTFQDNEVAYLFDVFQDLDFRMTERIRLRQDFKFAIPLEESDDYEVNFTAAVTSAVTESLNLSIRYELGYDNSLIEGLKEDRRFVSSVGWAF